MNAEIMHLRALTRLPTRRDCGVRFLVEDELQDMIARFLAPHLRAGESVTAIQDRARGLHVEIDATALQDAWRRRLKTGGAWDDEDDDLLRLDAILGALAQFERVAGPPPVTVQAIVLARPLPEAVATSIADAGDIIWRALLAERISHDAWIAAMRGLKRLRHALRRWPVSEARGTARVERIVDRALASPPPSRPLSDPGPNDVTLPEIQAAYEAAAAGTERIRLVSAKPWRHLFHEQGEIRIGALTLTLFKRDFGARGTISARHDDGRASGFDALHAMGPDPLHVIDASVFDRLCDRLEALEPQCAPKDGPA